MISWPEIGRVSWTTQVSSVTRVLKSTRRCRKRKSEQGVRLWKEDQSHEKLLALKREEEPRHVFASQRLEDTQTFSPGVSGKNAACQHLDASLARPVLDVCCVELQGN